jgi:hypothetical protein
MPKPPALADRAETAIAASEDDGKPDPQLFTVPLHQPSTDWPWPRLAPEASAGLDDPANGGQAWPRQFAVLLTEALAGVRPVRQLRPWLSERGRAHLHRLLPLFADGGHRPRITRVLTTRPSPDVVEMTLIVTVGPRTRALAVRLEQIEPARRPAGGQKLAPQAARPGSPCAQWRCTDIEAA